MAACGVRLRGLALAIQMLGAIMRRDADVEHVNEVVPAEQDDTGDVRVRRIPV